jgi:hypothetical protein
MLIPLQEAFRFRSSRCVMMHKTILYIGMMIATAAFTSAVFAQPGGQERDPFFGDRPGSAVTVTSHDSGKWGRDPFAKPFEGSFAGPATRAPEKKLTGIIYGNDVRIAIIGGEIVREGSMVGDQKLTSIRKRSIVLMSRTGGTEEIFLEDFTIRK